MPLPPPTRPHSSRALSAGPSSGIFASPAKRGGRKAEKDWDDAWDSSSDHEDHVTSAGAYKPMSVKALGSESTRQETDVLERRATPTLNSKATLSSQDAIYSGTGAWELVEAAEVQSSIDRPKENIGIEAVRSDVHDILRGTWQESMTTS